MQQLIAHIALLVDDYDRAIRFYTQTLGFVLTEDTVLSPTKRWVLVRPKGGGCALLLAKASNETQKNAIGKQSGGRVFLFLHTDNFERDYQNLLAKQVKIISPPRLENYGKVVVFEDIYGNLWDLVEPNYTKTHLI